MITPTRFRKQSIKVIWLALGCLRCLKTFLKKRKKDITKSRFRWDALLPEPAQTSLDDARWMGFDNLDSLPQNATKLETCVLFGKQSICNLCRFKSFWRSCSWTSIFEDSTNSKPSSVPASVHQASVRITCFGYLSTWSYKQPNGLQEEWWNTSTRGFLSRQCLNNTILWSVISRNIHLIMFNFPAILFLPPFPDLLPHELLSSLFNYVDIIV